MEDFRSSATTAIWPRVSTGNVLTVRVIVPYVTLYPQTRSSLQRYASSWEVEYRDVSGDEYAYGRLLDELWSCGISFCIIEQDIQIRADVLSSFEDCPHEFCAFPYAWTTTVGPALGCTRFRREFMEEYPNAMEQALDVPSAHGNPGHWKQLDWALICKVLVHGHGLQPCVHLPPVEHRNTAQALLPGADPTPQTVITW